MKTKWVWIICLTIFVWYAQVAFAAFNSGSTGADGEFAPTTNTALQLPESGVFNFTTVNIPSGVTVTFQKNSKNMPVTILAAGDVVINGAINVSGSGGGAFSSFGIGGPGGFGGGVGGWMQGNGYRSQGPGAGAGGAGNTSSAYPSACGGGGGFAGNGNNGGSYSNMIGGNGGIAYGNDGQLPMIGGSGGGGGGGTTQYKGGAGGGGGGAILIASSGAVTVNGAIYANGGSGNMGESPHTYYGYAGAGGGGSGGSLRLIANTIAGNGTISAVGANGGGSGWCSGGSGSDGRIRLEAWEFTRNAGTSPTSIVKWSPSAVAPSVLPSLSISSLGGVNVPTIPKGDPKNPDIMFPAGVKNPITVVVTANNIPVGTTVTVRMLPSQGNSTASAAAALSGSEVLSTASVQLNLPTAYPSLITVSATYQATASNGGPIYAGGERVDKIRVSANIGGESTVTYITESGKEIPLKQKET